MQKITFIAVLVLVCSLGISVVLAQTQIDTIPPAIKITHPINDSTIRTYSTLLHVKTSEGAVCKYSITAGRCFTNYCVGGGTPLINMSKTGGTSHSQKLSNLYDEYTYSIGVNCTDSSNNSNKSSVKFFVNISSSK